MASRSFFFSHSSAGPSSPSGSAPARATIRVEAPGTALLDWLAEFLSPSFTASPPGAERSGVVDRVRVDVDPERFLRLTSAGSRSPSRVRCFTLDGPGQELPTVRDESGQAYALDEKLGSAVHARPTPEGGRRVHVIASRERPDARLATMRVLRELESARALARGAVALHAGAAADEAGVTLFVGPRGAGKSTLLLCALAGGGARYVANDRVFAVPGPDGATVSGVPTIVGLRADGFSRVPGTEALGQTITSGAWHYASSVSECRDNQAAGRSAEGVGYRWPPGVAPAQLCSLLTSEPSAGGPLSCIVLPRVDPDGLAAGERFALRALPPSESASRILHEGLVAGGGVADFVSGAPAPDPAALAATVERLVGETPCLECRLGEGAYQAPSVWHAIRTTIAAGPPLSCG